MRGAAVVEQPDASDDRDRAATLREANVTNAGTLPERLCFALCRRIFQRRSRALKTYTGRNRDYASPDAWSSEDAKRYLDRFQRTVDFADKVVLDYACGSGAIAQTIFELARPREKIAVDSHAEPITRSLGLYRDISLRQVWNNDTLLRSGSVDIAYSTAFEHFEDPHRVLAELYRVVKPGGDILIHFIPWWGVEGAHLDGIMPMRWCHVFFSERTLFRTARRVVRSDFYAPLVWDFDEQGERRFDLYDHRDAFDPAFRG